MNAQALPNKKRSNRAGWFPLLAIFAGILPFGLDAQNSTGGAQEGGEEVVIMPRLEVVAQRQRHWQYARTSRIELLTDMDDASAAVGMAQALDMAVEHAEFIFPDAGKSREIPIKIIIYEGYEKEPDVVSLAQLARNREKWRHVSDPEQYIIVRPYTKRHGVMRDNFLNGLWVGQALFGGIRGMIMEPLDKKNTQRTYAQNLFLDCVHRASWIGDQNRLVDQLQHGNQAWIFEMAQGLFERFYEFEKLRDKPDIASMESKLPGRPAGNQYARRSNSRPSPLFAKGPFIPLGEILGKPPPRPPQTRAGMRMKSMPKTKEPDSSGKQEAYDDMAGSVAIKSFAWRRECCDFGYYCLYAKREKYRGACNVFMAVEPPAGKRLAQVRERKTAQDWSAFLGAISESRPLARKITLVIDNLNTHSAGSLYESMPPAQARALLERFEFVYTPKHGSWLNMAEIEINSLVSQCLKRRMPTIRPVVE